MSSRKKVDGNAAVQLGVIITPMLDMSFQLLSFFVITFRPQAQEGQIAMKLPAIEQPANPSQPIHHQRSCRKKKEDEYKIRVQQATGAIGTITISTAATVTEIAANDGEKLEKLKKILSEMARNRPKDKKGAIIKIEAANELKYSQLITLMDICRQSGYESVGVGQIPTETPPKQ